MIRSMPIQYEGRDVHLTTIGDALYRNKPKFMQADTWAVIEQHATPGIWHRIRYTMSLTQRPLKRLHDSMRQRAFVRGFDHDILQIAVSERDGICFSWTGKLMSEGILELIAERVQERAGKKRGRRN